MSHSRFHEMRLRNTQINTRELENRKIHLDSYPQAVFVELTQNCNLSCSMCRSSGPFLPEHNMSFGLYRKIADELFPYAQVVDLRGWGESTVLKSFRTFAEYAASFGCRLRIVTNLVSSDVSLWRYLVEEDFIVAVSFDAASPSTFAELRGNARLDRVLHNLQAMVEHCAKIGRSTEWIYLNVIVQGPAVSEMEDILRIARNLGLQRVHLQPVSLPRSHPNHLGNHINEVARMLDRVQQLADELGLLLVIGAALDDILALECTKKICIHPWMYCYVDYQGNVGFCDHLIGSPASEYLIGDLRQNTFRDIWNGEQFLQLRAQHVARIEGLDTTYTECNWCYRNRYVDFEDVVYPPYQRYLVSNRTVPRLYAPTRL